MLHGRCMDDVVHATEGALQALLVPHVADEETDGRILLLGEILGHFVLLQFIAAEDDQFAQLVSFQENLSAFFTERSCSPGY